MSRGSPDQSRGGDQCPQGHDHRADLQELDQRAIDEADESGGPETSDDGQPGIDAVVQDQGASDTPGQEHDRADREVDTADRITKVAPMPTTPMTDI